MSLLMILLIVVVALALFGGLGYSRRGNGAAVGDGTARRDGFGLPGGILGLVVVVILVILLVSLLT